MNMTKRCVRCGQVKDVSEFNKKKQNRDGYNCYCRTCYCRKTPETKEKEELLLRGLKRCNKCGDIKPLSDYHKLKLGVGGVHPTCSFCKSHLTEEKRKALEETNRLLLLGYKVCTHCGTVKSLDDFYLVWRWSKKTKTQSSHCKTCLEEHTHEYALKHPERVKGYKKKWSDKPENIERIKEWFLVYNQTGKKEWRKKYFEVLEHLITKNLRSRLGTEVKKANGKNKLHHNDLIGCTPDFLMDYLESRFTDGMTRSNYGRGLGKWGIDHIRPFASFDITDPEQQKICCDYTNLQPMWNIDNSIKGAKFQKEEIKSMVYDAFSIAL